jgi:hypothetical protein
MELQLLLMAVLIVKVWDHIYAQGCIIIHVVPLVTPKSHLLHELLGL